MNGHLTASVKTVLLTLTENFTFISSTLIREIAEYDGDVSPFVHPIVEVALKDKFQGRG